MTDMEKLVRAVVEVVQPSMLDWEVINVGDCEIRLPARLMTFQEMVDKGLVDGYEHYMPGDNAYIDIGTIHLRRPT